MTLGKLLRLYKHYKNNYDFKLSNISYRQLDEEYAHRGELFAED